MSLDNLIFPKIEHINDEKPQPIEPLKLRNRSSIRNNSISKIDFFEFLNLGTKTSQLVSKNSDIFPQFPNLASSTHYSHKLCIYFPN